MAVKSKIRPDEHGVLFEVTCVVGTVYAAFDGEESPNVAAFKLIAQHDAQGSYRFPLEDGRTCVVDVAYAEERA